MSDKQTRRDFLKTVAAGGVGLLALGQSLRSFGQGTSGKSRIVMVTNSKAQSSPGKFDKDIIKTMVFSGVKSFTGKTTDETAWKSLFKPTDVVGLKINCLFDKNASTHPEVVFAIIDGLLLAGVKSDNIIIWDRSDNDMQKNGYAINRDQPGVKCYGTNGDYEPQATQAGSFKGRVTKILTEKITALINVPILKDHGLAGITCSMKNHYGTIDNPGAQHGGNCNPYCADLNTIVPIRAKTKLIVCDAIRPLANGGPGGNAKFFWDHNTILVGTDHVALDYQGWQIIEARRKAINLPTLEGAGRKPQYIYTAESKGLGTANPAKMEIIKI